MKILRDLFVIVAHPFTLGLCCIVLTIILFAQINQNNAQSAEQECRDRIDATFLVEMARALQRLEAVWKFDAAGDEWGAVEAATPTDDEADDYEKAITRRENAVIICAGRT